MPFKSRVLDIVAAIPRGLTLSYGQVAALAGSPKAARAVGMIMKNNHDPAVPCHRVIRGDGKLCGYNHGGIIAKKQKLESEGISVTENYVVKN